MSISQSLILKSHGNDDGDEEFLVINQSPFIIGRRPDCQGQIPRADVSGRHAEFRFDGGHWTLIDHGSTNGTFLNGKRLTEPAKVDIGDLIHFATKGYQVVPKVERDSGWVSTTRMQDTGQIRGMMDLLAIVNEQRTYPHFQPIVDMVTQQPIGWESLGRAVASNGRMNPATLFFLAAQGKLESRLSMRFRESARDCAACRHCWPDDQRYHLFFNVHPGELREKNFGDLIKEFEASELHKYFRVVIEMPESLVCKTEEMAEMVASIRALGMQVAYDDFGQGQSRIPDLVTVPPDYLKLDRQLVASLSEHRVKLNLVKAIVDACKQLNVKTIAEGIETEEDLAACLELEIEYGQGFLFSRPFAAYELFRADSSSLPDSCMFVKLDLLSDTIRP